MSGIFGILKFLVLFVGGSVSSFMFPTAYASTKTDYKSTNYWDITIPPEDISENGRPYRLVVRLYDLYEYLLLYSGLCRSFWFTYIYHYKKNKKPHYTYGNKPIHIWTVTIIGIAVFIGIDATITTISNNDLRDVFLTGTEKEKPLKVEVMANNGFGNLDMREKMKYLILKMISS